MWVVNKLSFENAFPGLIVHKEKSSNVYSEDVISSCCLDKGKVKEAVDRIHTPMIGYSIKTIFGIIDMLDLPDWHKAKVKSELTGTELDVSLAKYHDDIEKELGL